MSCILSVEKGSPLFFSLFFQLSLLDGEGRAVLTEHYFTTTEKADDPSKEEDSHKEAVADLPLSGESRHTVSGEATTGREPLTEEGDDGRKRMVIMNVYCPMYDPARDEKGEGISRLQFKMKFYRLLEARCAALEQAGK